MNSTNGGRWLKRKTNNKIIVKIPCISFSQYLRQLEMVLLNAVHVEGGSLERLKMVVIPNIRAS